MNQREKRRTTSSRRITNILTFVVALTLVALIVIWIAWPRIVLHRFLDSIENSDLSEANAYCDGKTLRVATLPESRRIQVFVRSPGSFPWFSFTPKASFLREHFRAPGRTITDLAKGEIHGEKGGFLYGHLLVKGGQVSFQADLQQQQ